MSTRRITALFAGAFVLAMISWRPAAAQASDFQYKWPWRPGAAVSITTLPYQDVHGCPPDLTHECVAAYDIVITTSDDVVSSAEGVVTDMVTTVSGCGAGLHYGNYVDVGNVRYAHLASVALGLATGAPVLQGDSLGVQGATGNVIPCPGGKHLHWEFRSGTVPAVVDGAPTASVTLSSQPPSSNSVIGEFSTAGATLRSDYAAHGGWLTIGWTSAFQNGLNMVANYAWGRMQDFQHDPDGFGGYRATVHVANWDQAHAYRADSLIWPAWAWGGWDPVSTPPRFRPISMARQESGSCPPGSTPSCVRYQRFHLGYVWVSNALQVTATFCPDVFPLPDGDGIVASNDAQWVFNLYQHGTYDARADLNGDGQIASTEAQLVFAFFKQGFGTCHP